ncbi:hypothetical protein E2C01_032997 [Portunus trituberculatus]|uniref:Uncharacterized protein n=1 Tax=Portunus trituberculatus TaxID=210409 RepID=A0A5B7EWN3_PORTR|nr:hypothetical protein [Portunus trituberculatus]
MKEFRPCVLRSCFTVGTYAKCEEDEAEDQSELIEEEVTKKVFRKEMELGDLPRRLELLLMSPATTWSEMTYTIVEPHMLTFSDPEQGLPIY